MPKSSKEADGHDKPIVISNARTRQQLLYADPNAEKLFAKIDKVNNELLDAMLDKNSKAHQIFTPNIIAKLYERVLNHYEFRAQLDWAKEQYYDAGTAKSENHIDIGPVDYYA